MILSSQKSISEDKIVKVDFQKYTLDNGLDVILHADRTVPIVAVNLWYHVGSARETPGKSGFAHLFEHIMFQGSKHLPNGMHFKLIEQAGGSLNGSTSADRTNYWNVVPKNYYELPLWLESDRMGWLIDGVTQEKLDVQRDVVMNERRQNYDNRPYGLAFEILSKNLYPSDHPYSWMTIGSMEDLKNATLDDVKKFFRQYYHPGNASLAIGGDINSDEIMKGVEKYFGSITEGEKVDPLTPHIPVLKKDIRLIHEDAVQLPRIYIAWHTSHIFGPDDAELDMLADALVNGKNSRLYKSLVYESQIVQDVYAFHISREMGSLFALAATAKEGVDLPRIEYALFEEIEKLVESGLEERELNRIKNSHKSSYIYSLQMVGGFDGVADRLNAYNTYLGDPDFIHHDLDRYLRVEREDIGRVAEKYCLKNRKVILSVVPKGKKELAAADRL